jgi:hypothetical protein
MTSSSAGLPAPEGPGSVSGAPRLPAGFTDTFTSQYIDVGDMRLHAVIGGDGPPLLLIHERFAVVGVDTGLLIGYALAADYPDR